MGRASCEVPTLYDRISGRTVAWSDAGRDILFTPYVFHSAYVQVPAHNNYTDLVGAADFPSDFCQHTAHSAMVPVYMRLHEHHSVSPQIPASTGGKNDGFDDGLFNAYFRLMHCQESDGCVNVTDIAGNKSYYETYSPDHPNSHDVDTCRMCARAEKEREMRMKLRSPNYDVESMFESMGLGSDSDGDDDCFSDDPKNDAASRACDGIQDIIVTGRVRLASSFPCERIYDTHLD